MVQNIVRKTLRLFIAAVFSITVISGLFACDNYSVMDFICFNTGVYVAVKGDLSAETENSLKTAFKELENSLSVKGDGEIAAFNAQSAETPFFLSEDVCAVFIKAKELHSFTDGLFNPAVLPILRLWKLSSDTFDNKLITINPPTEKEITDILPLCDFNKISLDNGAIIKKENGICVDFGGIAKGYAADMAREILFAAGFTEGYISVGGSSIYVFSTDEDLSVVHPRKHGEHIFTVDKNLIKNSPLSTSGDYIRYYTDINGKRYPHIINGNTGYPADTGIISATVIAKDNAAETLRSACATDAISTALMLMNKESATEFIRSRLQGFYVFLACEKDGKKEIISNTDSIRVLDEDYCLKLI